MCPSAENTMDISCQYASEKQRNFTEAVVSSVSEYEIIEEYPDDRYFPSYLVCSRYRNTVFHVLFAADAEGGDVRVITAYIPGSDQWKDDLKTRR